MDFLASGFINKLDRFVSWTRDHQTFAISIFPEQCLSSTAAPSSAVSQNKGRGHYGDSDCTCLAKKKVLCGHCKSLGRRDAGSSTSVRIAIAGINLPSLQLLAFMVYFDFFLSSGFKYHQGKDLGCSVPKPSFLGKSLCAGFLSVCPPPLSLWDLDLTLSGISF